ncbi:hypothetical protein MMC09_004926 [Bachmanniomyces sp. S44760]|nr:hypothetical protein [Bachmanniomyces sp. S44760]
MSELQKDRLPGYPLKNQNDPTAEVYSSQQQSHGTPPHPHQNDKEHLKNSHDDPQQPQQLIFEMIRPILFHEPFKVLDLTPFFPSNASTDANTLHDQTQQIISSNPYPADLSPYLTATPQSITSRKYIFTNAHDTKIAEWEIPFSVLEDSTIEIIQDPFPPPSSSPSASSTIKLKSRKFFTSHSKSFIYDSVPYTWEMESKITNRRMVLYRDIGFNDGREVVGVFHRRVRGGGTIVLNGLDGGIGKGNDNGKGTGMGCLAEDVVRVVLIMGVVVERGITLRGWARWSGGW